MDLLEKMLTEEVGEMNINETKEYLKTYFGKDISNIRDYFEMLDARVAELKHSGGGLHMLNMQRQECFILANNFIGPDDTPSKVYLSRMIVPFSQVMTAKIMDDIMAKESTKLKYLMFNLHDTNISNFLRFLGYWRKYGYSKHVKFASSVRIEVLKEKNRCF